MVFAGKGELKAVVSIPIHGNPGGHEKGTFPVHDDGHALVIAEVIVGGVHMRVKVEFVLVLIADGHAQIAAP